MKAKIVKITEEKYRDRISLETCKKVLKAKENGYTDEQVFKIRDMLYALADIDFQIYQDNKNKATIIELNTVQDETQSNSLHSGVNRRAS
jgi:hypothetical protein